MEPNETTTDDEDDDMTDELGEPTCTLGEACESCQ